MDNFLKEVSDHLSTKEFWYFFIPTASGFVIYFLSVNTRNEKKYLQILFKSNQKLSLKIQADLTRFIEEYDAYDAIAFPEKNLSYGHYLEQMQASYAENLSEDCYKVLVENKKLLTKPMLTSYVDSLNKQNESLRLIDIDMQMVIRKAEQIYK